VVLSYDRLLMNDTFHYIMHGPHFTFVYNDCTLNRQLLKYWYSVTYHPEDGPFEQKHVGVSVESKRTCICWSSIL
jgi:hypothetical protein